MSRRRSMVRRTLVATTAVALAGAGLTVHVPSSVAADPAQGELGSRFTLAVLPDTQFYSRYAGSNFEPDYGTNPFAVQTQWIADHADDLNIPFTVHLGDVVDQVGSSGQWEVADRAMSTLDRAGDPYTILAGNHDVRDSTDSVVDTDYDLAQEPYLKTFTPDRAAAQPTDGATDPTGLSQYQVFEAEGQQFLVLALPWRVSDATLEWADRVLDDHPTLPVILTSHDIIGIRNDGVTGYTSVNGERLWDGFIADHDQVFLTLNGHYHGAAVTHRENDFGHEVTQVLIDYQMAYEGGNGYMGLYEFDLSGNSINVATVSPWVAQKPAERLTSFDVPVLEGDEQQFSIDIDFAQRFSGFTTTFGPGGSQEPSLRDRAIALVTDGFPGVPADDLQAAGSADDFVDVEGTLAHWQMVGTPGTLAQGTVITDVSGSGNDLHRATAEESGSTAAEDGDVSLDADAHLYAPSQQSVCFANATSGRLSYLTTGASAPVNDADFSDGYTIETFLKLDPGWTDANAWSKALTRTGNRSTLEGMPWSQWDYTASPAALGISNLREFQWTEIGGDATKGDRTNWSGEIMVGTWNHIALVNDPASAETTMYVNGAPVLRTAQDTVGQSFNEGMAWIIGSDWVNDAATNGWNGCVGETRIVDHPLESSEWLTARPDLSGFTVTGAPDGPVDLAEEEAVTLTGTGVPRASVTVSVGDEGGDAVSRDSVPSTVVAADGTWAVDVPVPSLGGVGTYALELAQGFGERVSEPVTAVVTISDSTAVDPTPTPTPSESADPDPDPEPEPSQSGAPDPGPTPTTSSPADGQTGAADGSDGTVGASQDVDGLARTGVSSWLVPVALISLASVVAGAAVLLARRQRLS